MKRLNIGVHLVEANLILWLFMWGRAIQVQESHGGGNLAAVGLVVPAAA